MSNQPWFTQAGSPEFIRPTVDQQAQPPAAEQQAQPPAAEQQAQPPAAEQPPPAAAPPPTEVAASATAPAVQPPTWSGRKTAIAAALAIGFASVGAVAASALPDTAVQTDQDRGPQGGFGGPHGRFGGVPGQPGGPLPQGGPGLGGQLPQQQLPQQQLPQQQLPQQGQQQPSGGQLRTS